MTQSKKEIILEQWNSKESLSFDIIAFRADCPVSYVKSVVNAYEKSHKNNQNDDNAISMENIAAIIQKHSLTVRCLPYETVNYWSYKDGDENKVYVDAKGNRIEAKREVIIQDFDLAHFQKTPPQKWCTDNPEKRFSNWRKNNPNGKKLLKETKTVKNGGWWYVKETKNTDSTIRFSREYDKFFAPTLEEAIRLYLNSIV